jgi:GAF domain-containing protein
MSARRLDVERLAQAHRATVLANATVGGWWKRFATSAETVTTNQSLDQLFAEAVAALRVALEVDSVAILLADDTTGELVARAAVGLSAGTAFGPVAEHGPDMVNWVLTTRRPLLVADLKKAFGVGADERSLRSIVAVPVLAGGNRPIGVLSVGSREVGRFTALDSAVLELAADRLSIAIDRVQRFEAEHAARTEAERLARRLARLQRITMHLVAAGTLEEVAATLVDALTEDPGLDAAALWVLSEEQLRPLGAAGEPVPLASDHPAALVARHRQPQFHEDDPLACALLGMRNGGATPSSVAVVPVLLGARCLGVLAAEYRSPRIPEEERELLESVVGQTALALERARLANVHDQLARVSAYFAHAAKVLAEGSDLSDTLERLASVAVMVLGEICLIDVVGEDGEIVRMVARHKDPTRQFLVDRLRARFAPTVGGPHPAAAVIATGKTQWSENIDDTVLAATTQNEEHRAIVRALELRSFISVPLRSNNQTLGCVTLLSATRCFDAQDVVFAEQLAEQVAAVVSKARQYEIATQTSHILQTTLLPQRFVELQGLEVHTRYVAAAEGLEVGGDFFDVVAVSDAEVAFMIGDVAGHDRVAAGMMGQLRSAARMLIAQSYTPAEIIETLQGGWEILGFDRMATAIFGLLHIGTGALVLASAGHHPPLVIEASRAHFVPVSPSPPLGVEGPCSSEWKGVLGPNQVLLLYTDGTIDERRMGTQAALHTLASTVSDGDARIDLAALCDRVVDQLSPDRVDDVALLALRRKVDDASPARCRPLGTD